MLQSVASLGLGEGVSGRCSRKLPSVNHSLIFSLFGLVDYCSNGSYYSLDHCFLYGDELHVDYVYDLDCIPR